MSLRDKYLKKINNNLTGKDKNENILTQIVKDNDTVSGQETGLKKTGPSISEDETIDILGDIEPLTGINLINEQKDIQLEKPKVKEVAQPVLPEKIVQEKKPEPARQEVPVKIEQIEKFSETDITKKNEEIEKSNAVNNLNRVVSDTNTEPNEDASSTDMNEETITDENAVELLVFEVNKSLFSIETKYVSEILELQEITTIPLTKNYLLGLINIRNEIVSVVDLNKLMMNQYTPPDKNNRMVILHDKSIQTGIIVNKIQSISIISENSIIDDIGNIGISYNDLILKIARIKDVNIPVINIEKLFKSEDFTRVEE